eukprot:2951468-Prymnesium_polylepis.1
MVRRKAVLGRYAALRCLCLWHEIRACGASGTRYVRRAAGQGGWDLRKRVVSAHKWLTPPRSAPCV